MTVRSKIVGLLLRGPPSAPSKEAVLELIREHAAKQQGPRKGWQVKAAAWVKKMQVDRGAVKVGVVKNGQFTIIDSLRPRYLVPQDLDKFELKPYVQNDAPADK